MPRQRAGFSLSLRAARAAPRALRGRCPLESSPVARSWGVGQEGRRLVRRQTSGTQGKKDGVTSRGPMPDPIDDLSQRWKRNPDASSTIALCESLRSVARPTLVQQVEELAQQKYPSDVTVLLAVARMYLETQRLADAQGVLVSAGKLAPRDGSIYRWLGEVLLRRGDAERAEKVLERAMQLGTNDTVTRLWLDRA